MEPYEKPNQGTFNQWHDDPANWKFGVFYYNPKDKRLFPPKRVKGLGWTVNFANPISVLIPLLFIFLIFLVEFFVLNNN